MTSRVERRRSDIADFVLDKRSASPSEIAEKFEVSLMTVHRDLDELERQGILRKSRGDVTAQPSSVFESNIAYRLSVMQDEKLAIARRAVSMVEPGMAVMLDDATTILPMARLLTSVGSVTIVTNSLRVVNALAAERSVRLLVLGGIYDPLHESYLGDPCVEAIESTRVDLAFVGTSSVSDGVAYHQEDHIVSVKKAMLNVARRSVLLVDHTKFERSALHRLVDLSFFDRVIVDDGLSSEHRRSLDQAGVNYEMAST